MSVQHSNNKSDTESTVSEDERNVSDLNQHPNNNLHNTTKTNPFLLTNNTLLDEYYLESDIQLSTHNIDIFTIATLNVNGINNPVSQEMFIQLLPCINVDILRLTDTKLPSLNASH